MSTYKDRIKFVYTFADSHPLLYEYPSNLEITVECDGDSSIYEVVEAFKMILKGSGYSDLVIERVFNANRD